MRGRRWMSGRRDSRDEWTGSQETMTGGLLGEGEGEGGRKRND